jgi:transposase-like protein
MEHAKRVRRRQWRAEGEGAERLRSPGASVAQVASTCVLNANLVHTWRWQAAGVPGARSPEMTTFFRVI